MLVKIDSWTEISFLLITWGDYILSGVHVELIQGDVEAIKYNLVMNQSCCLSTDVTEKLKFREKFIICKQETCSLVALLVIGSHLTPWRKPGWGPNQHSGRAEPALQRSGAKVLIKPCLKAVLPPNCLSHEPIKHFWCLNHTACSIPFSQIHPNRHNLFPEIRCGK